MKTKVIVLLMLVMLTSGLTLQAQTAAVTDLSVTGLSMSPEIAGKLTRIELVKTGRYNVLDEFDMESALEGKGDFSNCYGKNCLIELGEALDVDMIFSGFIDQLGPKTVITLKIIDVNNKTILKSKSMEFGRYPDEIQRMIEIVLKEMLDLDIDEETKKRLEYNHDYITSTNVGKVSNAGPRFGISYVGIGELNEFYTRSKREGGLESLPIMTNLGYQFEIQYVGTENFSALFEVIPNLGGLEQGHFIPSISFLNGFRFGKSGWEFAFGPSFGARRMVEGLDVDGAFMTKKDYEAFHEEQWLADPMNYDSSGYLINTYVPPSESYTKRMDTRGNLEFNTNWLMAFGRTFIAGALNIPVNIYYSGNKYGGVIGTSVGFNIVTSKESINQKF